MTEGRMDHRAYLVAMLDVTRTPPTVVHAGIYSASAPNITGRLRSECRVGVAEAIGGSFAEASEVLQRQIDALPNLQWARQWIPRERS